MCYAKPGPRCSTHALKRLAKAKAEGDINLIQTALIEYQRTPAGIAELRQAGKESLASERQSERTRMISDYKDSIVVMEHIRNCLQEFEGDEYYDITLNQIKYYRGKYGMPEVGRTRAVFDRGDGYVIKVPITGEGYLANSNEVKTSQAEEPWVPVAECWYEDDYSVSERGMPVLIMEKVNYRKASEISKKDLPDWVGYVDCGQVGYNRKGELVAYDL